MHLVDVDASEEDQAVSRIGLEVEASLPHVWWYAVRTYAKARQWRGVWLMLKSPVYLSRVCWHYLHERGTWLEWRAFGRPVTPNRVTLTQSLGEGSPTEGDTR